MNRFTVQFLLLAVLFLTAAPGFAEDALSSLSPAAQEVAKDIGIIHYINELQDLKNKLPEESRKTDVHLLYVRQEITDLLLTTLLETRDAVAELDDQIARATEIKDVMQDRRDRAIRLNNITNFVSGGALAMIGSGVQIGTPNALQNGGNILEVVAGGLSTSISGYALKQSGGERRSAAANTNMLAKIFELPDVNDSQFPDSLWKYLNDPAVPGSTYSRRQILIERWVRLKRVQSLKTKEGMRRAALLSGAVPQTRQVTIDLLDDRAFMLSDLRTAVSQMSRQLLEIMRLIRKT